MVEGLDCVVEEVSVVALVCGMVSGHGLAGGFEIDDSFWECPFADPSSRHVYSASSVPASFSLAPRLTAPPKIYVVVGIYFYSSLPALHHSAGTTTAASVFGDPIASVDACPSCRQHHSRLQWNRPYRICPRLDVGLELRLFLWLLLR
jgi:hypothetical protein